MFGAHGLPACPGSRHGSSGEKGAEWGAPAEQRETEIILAAVRLPELCTVRPNLVRYVHRTHMFDLACKTSGHWVHTASCTALHGPCQCRCATSSPSTAYQGPLLDAG